MAYLARNAALLARFRRGEPAALTEVYRAYVDHIERVVRYGFHIIGASDVRVPGMRREEVADLVQETFSRAFTERARLAYDGLRDYGPFLTTIARNLLVDRARRRGREISLEALGVEWREEAAPEDEPFADDATMKLVREYLADLGPQLRAVHEERYVRAVSQEEAAARLGLTRQRLRTLEKKLREGLAERIQRAGLSLDEPSNQPAPAELRMEKKTS
jgi:RNA polymerase sigma-70 factor (ECF subfamily)